MVRTTSFSQFWLKPFLGLNNSWLQVKNNSLIQVWIAATCRFKTQPFQVKRTCHTKLNRLEFDMACLDEHKDSNISFIPCLPFLYLNLSSPIGLAKHDKHCVQFADSISASKVIYRVFSEEFANCMQCRSGYAIPLVILTSKPKNGDEVKMFFFLNILDHGTQQSLSNHITFRSI